MTPLDINSGDTAWILTSAALVLLMTPGLAFFYGGMVRAKSVLNMLMMSFIAWDRHGRLGALRLLPRLRRRRRRRPDRRTLPVLRPQGPRWRRLRGGTPARRWPSSPSSVFAIITPALISGAIADRVKFAAWMIFVRLWVTLVYFPVAHWVFASARATAAGSPTTWAIDFAGGTAVHINAGAAALGAGPRPRQAASAGKKDPMRPHNLPLVMLGAGLLWFGWFGFNAGSALGRRRRRAAVVFVNTRSPPAPPASAGSSTRSIRDGYVTTLGAASGVVAGLVAITPACGPRSARSAPSLVGAIAGVLCAMAVGLKYKLGYDDSLDVVGVHLVGGHLGSLLVGFFATEAVPAGVKGLFYGGGFDQLGKQAVGALAVLLYSFVSARPRPHPAQDDRASGLPRTTRSPASTRSSTPRRRTTSAAGAAPSAPRAPLGAAAPTATTENAEKVSTHEAHHRDREAAPARRGQGAPSQAFGVAGPDRHARPAATAASAATPRSTGAPSTPSTWSRRSASRSSSRTTTSNDSSTSIVKAARPARSVTARSGSSRSTTSSGSGPASAARTRSERRPRARPHRSDRPPADHSTVRRRGPVLLAAPGRAGPSAFHDRRSSRRPWSSSGTGGGPRGRASPSPASAASPGASWARARTSTSCSCTTAGARTGGLDGLSERLWYPLWDARVKMDHSVRTPAECTAVAAREVTAGVGLLDLRVVAGDGALVSSARTALLTAWRTNARRRLPELLDSLDERLARSGDAAYLLEPDLKEARGGLRDMTMLRALAATLADRPPARDGRGALRAAPRRPRRPARRLRAQPGPAARDGGRRGGTAARASATPDDLRRDVSLGARRIAHAVDLTVRAARQAVPQRRVLSFGRRERRPEYRTAEHGLIVTGGQGSRRGGPGPRRDRRRPPTALWAGPWPPARA